MEFNLKTTIFITSEVNLEWLVRSPSSLILLSDKTSDTTVLMLLSKRSEQLRNKPTLFRSSKGKKKLQFRSISTYKSKNKALIVTLESKVHIFQEDKNRESPSPEPFFEILKSFF